VSVRFDKDKWIKHALVKRYLIALEDGTIMRCVKADTKGNLLSSEYKQVAVQIHKKSGRAYFNCAWMGFTKSILVNRIVAWMFYPNPDNLPQVNHIDGDKENNAKSNLEWSSGSDNEKHAHRTGLKTGRGSSNSNAKLTAEDIHQIRASTETPTQIAERYDVSRSTITNIIKRKTWIHV
jgi:hypothetical protein